MTKEEYYKNPSVNNACLITVYKSSRKNAKVERVSFRHLIPSDKETRRVSDEVITRSYIGVLDKLVTIFKKFDNIEYSSSVDIFRLESYGLLDKTRYSYIELRRCKTQDINVMLEDLKNVFDLVYPYNLVSLGELKNNPSVKFICNKLKER